MTLHAPAMLGALANATTAVRLSLHVLAAAVWVGGQLTIAGLLPTLRRLGDDAPRKVARAFARIEWPVFALLVGTGIWNVVADDPSKQSATWNAVLGVKIGAVAVAGLAAYWHGRARTRAGLAAFGGIAGLASLAALVLGVLLAG
jgi:putative copper export protein